MILLALRTLRLRWASSLGAFLSLLAAAAVVTACGVLLESGLRTQVPTERYAAADLVLGGRQAVPGDDPDEAFPERVGVPAEMVARVRQVAGVRAAVADHAFPARLVGPGAVDSETPSWGHGWGSSSLTPFTLQEGQPPTVPGEIVLDPAAARQAGVSLGSTVTVATRQGPLPRRVVGLAAPADGRTLTREATLFFSDAEAAELAGDPTTVDAIGVFAAPGVPTADLQERLEQVVGTAAVDVLTGDDRGRPEFLDSVAGAGLVVAVAGTFGGIALAIALFVVAGTVALSVAGRQQELALMRAVGATPGQLRVLLGSETVLTSVLAGMLGWPLGGVLARWLRDQFVTRGLVASDFELRAGWVPLLVAVGATTGIAAAAAWLAGRRVGRIRPVAALAEATTEAPPVGWLRVSGGIVVLAGTAVLGWVTLSMGDDAALATSIALVFGVSLAVALLGPVLTAVPAAVLATALRVFPVTGYLAAANVRTRSRRLASVVAPLVLGVGFTGAGLFTETTSAYSAAAEAEAGTRADVVLAGPLLPPDLVERAAQLPGVASAAGLSGTTVVAYSPLAGEVESELHPAQGIGGPHFENTLDLGLRAGRLQDLHGDTVALSSERAADLQVGVGDALPLSLGDGTAVRLTVVAVYDRGLGFPDLTLPRDLVLAHTTSGLDDLVLVHADPGTDLTQVHALLTELVSSAPGTTVLDRSAAAASRSAGQDSDTWVSYLLIAVLVTFIAVAVTNTVVIATSERSRELALLRLLGLTRGQVLRMVAAEALVAAATAVVFGTIAAASTLVPVSLALTGQPVPHAPLPAIAAIVVAVTGLTLGSAVGTARLVLRRRSIDVIGSRT